MENREDKILQIENAIKRVNLDIDIVKLELQSYKVMKKGAIMTTLLGILTLIAISFNIYKSNIDMDILNTICVSVVTSTIVLQANEIINHNSNIRKSNMHLEIKNRVLDELNNDLNNELKNM